MATPAIKRPSNRARLTNLYLEKFVLKSGLLKHGSVKLGLASSSSFELNTLPPSEEGRACRATLLVAVKVIGKIDGQEKAAISMDARYEARFIFPKGMSMEEVDAICQKEDYRFSLTAEAYAVAMAHVRLQLDMAGVGPRAIPIGF